MRFEDADAKLDVATRLTAAPLNAVGYPVLSGLSGQGDSIRAVNVGLPHQRIPPRVNCGNERGGATS